MSISSYYITYWLYNNWIAMGLDIGFNIKEMAIPESQLETWSHPGATTTAKATADSIRNALNGFNWPEGADFEVYLQGSYKNDTNIRGDSDVDVVAQLNSTFFSNLSDEQKNQLGLPPASYSWTDFKADVLAALRSCYGQNYIIGGDKSLKLLADSGRLPADVVVCAQYRKYRTVSAYDYVEGMCFWSLGNRQIINYPKIHYENGVSKHQSSEYKPIVRIFKNLRTFLEDNGHIQEGLAPSYFLECLLYNIADEHFESSYQETFCNIVNHINNLSDDDLGTFVCQHQQHPLFGENSEQWVLSNTRALVSGLISAWNNWSN
jgi:hypothetical protein